MIQDCSDFQLSATLASNCIKLLNAEDQIHIAVLNYLQEAYCTALQPDQLVSGEVQASINVIKRKVAEHGISLQFEDGLFVVRSAEKVSGVAP